MSQSDHQILIQSRPYFYASVFAGLLILANLFNGQFDHAIFTAILCATLLVNKVKSQSVQDLKQNITWLRRASIVLAVTTLIGLNLNIDIVNTWLYFVPLLVFFFYDFNPALWLIGIFSLLALLSLHTTENALENIQITLNYLLYLGISGGLVYLREVRRKQLKPLRRTDNLTMAASREHLDNDLTKEVQRSEREGSDLATMALAVDQICLSKLSSEEQETVTINIGKLLHNNLRLFDSYYLWNKHEFFVVLPHTSSAQAVKIANALRVQTRKNISINDEHITISIGVAGLNVGDDSQTLTHRAAQALKETQSKSTNRTQPYREKKHTDQVSPDSTDQQGRSKS